MKSDDEVTPRPAMRLARQQRLRSTPRRRLHHLLVRKQATTDGGLDDLDSSDSSAYLISQSNPSDIAETLGMRNAKIIGGQVIGKIRFESGQHERDYLAEAGDSFCFPLMEQRLMLTGAMNALQCAEDLALKSYVAARCASRLFRAEHDQPLHIASLE